eukprot:Skav212576  [mRNA]  locus=scaffold125:324505:324951:- [translate_table: standard]
MGNICDCCEANEQEESIDAPKTGGVDGKAVAEQKIAANRAGTVTLKVAMPRLMQAARPGAGSPPPQVVGEALKATNAAPTAENVRTSQIALGDSTPQAAMPTVGTKQKRYVMDLTFYCKAQQVLDRKPARKEYQRLMRRRQEEAEQFE